MLPTLLRGIVWFGLYVLLALLPLGVALVVDPIAAPRPLLTDASVALAFIAFALMMIQFALVSRLALASEPFGTDALIQFHRGMGLVALAFAIAHPLLLRGVGTTWQAWSPFHGAPATRMGAASLWLAVLVVGTSLARKRLRLSYETWQVIHLAGAGAIAGTALVHMLEIAGYSRGRTMQWALVGYTGLFLALLLRHRVLRPLLLWRHGWEVVANLDAGGSTRLVRVRPVGHAGFQFDPGQFAWLVTGRTPFWAQQHPISIASGAELSKERMIEFAIKALGDWSGTTVPALQPGIQVWVDGPFGAFTPERHPGQGLVLIAGGIGIAPLRSMMLSMRDREDLRPVLLFYAAANWERVILREEIEQLKEHLDLRVVYVFENPDPDWTGERGFITVDILRRHLPKQFLRYQYFVCGPVPMMDSLEKILTEVGIPAPRIHTERFQMV